MFQRDFVLPLNQIEIAERVTRGGDAALIVCLRVQRQSGLQMIQSLIGVALLEQTAAGGEGRGRICLSDNQRMDASVRRRRRLPQGCEQRTKSARGAKYL